MREVQLLQRQALDSKRISIIYKQMVFIDTRLQAMESVFMQSTLFERMFSPRDLVKKVDALHLTFLQKHDDALRKDEEEQAKPKLTIVSPGVMSGKK